MNLSEALAFDTEGARQAVETQEYARGLCDTTYPMVAYEVIDLLKGELRRLYAVELKAKTGMHILSCMKALVMTGLNQVEAEKLLRTDPARFTDGLIRSIEPK